MSSRLSGKFRSVFWQVPKELQTRMHSVRPRVSSRGVSAGGHAVWARGDRVGGVCLGRSAWGGGVCSSWCLPG